MRRLNARHHGQMGRGEATERYLIQARKSTDYNGRKYNEDPLALPMPSTSDSFQIVCKYFIEAVETQK
jgi:hypothetical protein